MPELLAQTHALEQRLRVRAIHAAPEGHAELDIFQCRVPLQQIERLENIADRLGAKPIAAGFTELGRFTSVEPDAAAIGRENAGDQIEKGRFARTTFTAQR